MIVKELQISHIRAIKNAEFKFQEGFNLIIGVNGVGKSTVLDVLRICLSRVLRMAIKDLSKSMTFEHSDIMIGQPFLDATILFDLFGEKFRYSRHEASEKIAKDDDKEIEILRREILENVRLRDRQRELLRSLVNTRTLPNSDTYDPPELTKWQKMLNGLPSPPLAVYFATNRSVLSSSGGLKGKTASGKASAYSNALIPRAWNIRELAYWLKAQSTLTKERPLSAQHVAALQNAASRFLPDCTTIRPSDGPDITLMIEKSGTVLDVCQLSDGERGVLSMVLDLARRLSQANVGANDPLTEGQAVVLIDEIDLHLHPKWQRQIVQNLTKTFPRCQFIATTHSPQVIGEVEHHRIQIIGDGQVYSPTYSYGVDSNRVLEEVMEADPRTEEVQDLLKEISNVIGSQNFTRGRQLLTQFVEILGENDPEVTRISILLDFVEGNE